MPAPFQVVGASGHTHTSGEVAHLVDVARRLWRLAKRYEHPNAPLKPGVDGPALAARMRAMCHTMIDDARQAKRLRPKAKRCDERFGYGWHVCAMDHDHTGTTCRCRCGEESDVYPF